MPTDQAFLDNLSEQPITRETDLSRFKCEPNVDWFLHEVAKEYHEKRITTVTLWMDQNEIAGYTATLMSSVEISESPQRERLGLKGIKFKKVGQKDHRFFPAFLIGMLGTCERYQRRGLAMHMLKVTIGRARALSDDAGCRFVTVDSDRTDAAVGLYTAAGFQKVERNDDKRETIWMYFDLGKRS